MATSPGFAAALMLKDLKLSQEAAKAAGAATPLGAHAAEIYAAFEAAGQGGADFSGHHQLSPRAGGEVNLLKQLY